MEPHEPQAQEAKPGVWDRVKQFVEMDQQKMGGTTLQAMGSLGLNELRAAFSPGGNIEQPTPPGMYGNATQGEIADAREGKEQTGGLESHQEMPSQSKRLTPSQIGRGEFTPKPEQQHGQEQQMHQSHGRRM